MTEEAEYDSLTEATEDDGETDVDLAGPDADAGVPVLRGVPVGDIQLGHDLEAAGDGRGQGEGRAERVHQHAVDAARPREVERELLVPRLARGRRERGVSDRLRKPEVDVLIAEQEQAPLACPH